MPSRFVDSLIYASTYVGICLGLLALYVAAFVTVALGMLVPAIIFGFFALVAWIFTIAGAVYWFEN